MNIASNFSKETLTIPGVYQITNKTNGHKYIGSSINIWKRWGRHLSELRKNTHDNNYLQNAWNKYGEDNFEFGVLLFCDVENTLLYEQLCLDKLNPEYNIATDAQASFRGTKRSAETRAKMSAAKLGHKYNVGYNHSDEAKAKISKAAMGNKYGIGNKNSLGRKASDETLAKMKESQRLRHLREKGVAD